MKSWRNEKLLSRGLPRAVLFQKSAFLASRARRRSRRGQNTFEKPVFRVAPLLSEAAERRKKQATARRSCNSF